MYSVVLCTAKKHDARRIANIIVKERLAACVNIVPVKSVYRWEGKVANENESLLLIKTKSSLFAKLAKTIKSAHPYRMPEILELKVSGGNKKYLDWIKSSTLFVS